MKILEVVILNRLPRHLDKSFTFFSKKDIASGALVLVPVGQRKLKGLVVNARELNKLEIKKGLPYSLRGILRVIAHKPKLHKLQISLAKWISDYYLTPLGQVLAMFIRRKKNNTPAVMRLSPAPGMLDRLFDFDEKLRQIILEKEHSELYKLQQSPRFNVRDVALKIAQITGAKFKLLDHSPTLESYKYLGARLKLKKKQFQLIDMRLKKNKSVLSPELISALEKSPAALLILNRLGSATFILCQDCGFVKKCASCEAPMVYHQNLGTLLCHHCSQKQKPIFTCENCKGVNIDYLGTGVEKIRAEIKKLKLENILVSTLKEKLPQKALIAVVSLDHILNLPDFRAAEKTFRVLVRLNNLAKQEFIVQTFQPEHYVFELKNFYQNELKIRAENNLPPFSCLIKLTYKHKNPTRAQNEAERLASLFSEVLGPSPAFIPKIRGFFVWKLVLKATPETKKKLNKLNLAQGWTIDVDPIDLL